MSFDSQALDAHIALFNKAVTSGDFSAFTASFAPDAVMKFAGVPAGPYLGRDAIASAYAENPPDDTMTVLSHDWDGDRLIARFKWDSGGMGQLSLRWRESLVTQLFIAFDPHPLPQE